jgi:hypothetical protein
MIQLSKTIRGRSTPVMNYYQSAMLYCFSLVVLGAILILRELQNARMIKGLMDRLLIANDMEPLPDADILSGGVGLPKPEESDVKKKLESALRKLDVQNRERKVMFKIPNMPVSMGDIMKGK